MRPKCQIILGFTALAIMRSELSKSPWTELFEDQIVRRQRKRVFCDYFVVMNSKELLNPRDAEI